MTGQDIPKKADDVSGEIVLLVVLATLWGGAFTLIKLGVATIPPVTLIAARTFIAALVLLVVLRLRGVRLPRDRTTWAQFLIQAAFNSVLPFTLIAWAELHIDASLAAILNATTPVFTFLLTWGLIRHEPATFQKFAGVAAGLVGICLIIGTQALEGLGTDFLAQLSMVAATVAYACAAIFGTRFRHLDAMAPAAGSLVCGSVVLIPLSLIIDRPWTLQPSTSSVLALLVLAVFSTSLAFVIYFRLFRTLGSVGATAQAYLRVPIGVAIGSMFLGESLSATAWIGLAFVVAGVAAMTAPAGSFTRRVPKPLRVRSP